MKTTPHTATIGGPQPTTSYRRLSEDKEARILVQLPEFIELNTERRYHRDDLVVVEVPGGVAFLPREVWAAGVRA
jgi:hypothetical protein